MRLGFLFLFFYFYWSSYWGDGSIGYSQAWIWSPLACLLLTTGFHSLHRLTRALQRNESQVALMIDSLQGWNSVEGKWGRAAKFGAALAPEVCVSDKGRPLTEASSALCAQPWLYLTALWSKWGSWNECQDVYSKCLLSDFLRKATLVLELRPMGRKIIRILNLQMDLETTVWGDL